jgi:putative ABC transport system ATP-binding protein
MSAKTVIQTEDLTKIYGVGDIQVRALDGVNLTIRQNEFVAIMGPSGSGKSTLMNILGCLDRPTSGHYYLDGEDISQMNKNQLAIIRNKQIGFIFQSFNLLANTSALDNVLLPLLYSRNGNGHLSLEQQREKGMRALAAVGLSERSHHKPHEMSGGQVQRVAIARALINDPVMILADEPTGNLDTRSGEEVMNLLLDLHRQGSTIVMVTHDDEIAAYAQRMVRFRDGVIETDRIIGHSMQGTAPVEAQILEASHAAK